MNIIFNCLNSGLGNNGGSRTIVRSANTLQKMGHEVCILNPEPQRKRMGQYLSSSYTWDVIEVPVLHHIEHAERGDVIIATAFSTVKSTMEAPEKFGKKVHWLRGWETWSHNVEWIKENVLNQPTLKIVNSICLQNKLKEYGVESEIIRPGYDFHEILPLNIRQNNKTLTIGALYNKGEKRKDKRVDWIFRAVKEIKEKMKVCLIMFGGDGIPPKDAPVDLFIPNPITVRKNEIYNRVDIWLAPTCNDSLTLPPAEAMQTECCVVGTQAPMNGMKDYLIHKETGYESFDNYESFKACIYLALLEEENRIKYGKVGREKIQSLGTREYNMTMLLDYLEDNINV
jgi:glycosyltransferase involved in cell wall biosynthesis